MMNEYSVGHAKQEPRRVGWGTIDWVPELQRKELLHDTRAACHSTISLRPLERRHPTNIRPQLTRAIFLSQHLD